MTTSTSFRIGALLLSVLSLTACTVSLPIPSEDTTATSAAPTAVTSSTISTSTTSTSSTSTGTSKRMKVGSCYAISGEKEKAGFTESGCSTKDPLTFLVVSEGHGTPSCDKGMYSYTYGAAADPTSDHVCMVANLQEGSCYGKADGGILAVMSCTDSRATMKAAKVINKADASMCPSGTEPYPFTDPGVTYCLAPPR